MLKTIEAILEPSGQVRLLEPVHVFRPSRVLLTLLEPATETQRGNATALLQRLKDNPLPPQYQRNAEEIDEQIEQERNAWE
jgi:hypothetical protein